MASLIPDQVAFSEDLDKMKAFARSRGLYPREGEGWRQPEMQEILVAQGKSHTTNSRHQERLAHDFEFVRREGGQYVPAMTAEYLEPVGNFWESLSPKNKWGGHFKIMKNGKLEPWYDCGHFERRA